MIYSEREVAGEALLSILHGYLARDKMTTLSAVRPGSSVRVLKLEGQPDVCHRLREMGFSENSVIRCLQVGPSCVCQIQHARVGLSGQLARQILVEPLR